MSSDARTNESRCPLCGRPLPETAVAAGSESNADEVDASAATAGDAYCSSGCREIDAALDPPAGVDAGDEEGDGDGCGDRSDDERHAGRSTAAEDNDAGDEPGTATDDYERTFFRVDGMHSATCETFLESVAEKRDGVAGAAASYVTEVVRVDYDPDRISTADLRDALSTLGYTAYLREEARADDDAGATRRSREMTGLRKRRSEDFLEIQYIAGIVFGSFLLVPYAAVFYPMFLAAYSDWGPLRYYDAAFTGFDNLLFLPLFSVVTGVVLYLTGLPLLRGAYVSLKLRRPNTQLLAALTIVSAYVYGTASFFLGRTDLYYDLTIVVAALVMGAIFAEATVKRQATERLTDLTISQVETARVLEPNGSNTTEVPVADLEPDDRVLVREGERVPVDGVLVDSTCTVDEAVVTGESLPVAKEPGDAVIGGSVVTDGAAVADVGPETESSIERLTEVVWNLQSAAHGVQRRADALAVRVAPLVLGAAAVVGAVQYVRIGDPVTASLAALLTIMVASPWALGLATPASVAANIRDAMAQGIVVFDETVFERLRDVDVVVFDKTGTLTTGEMTVLEADAPDELLAAAAALERRASHPAATAIAGTFGAGSDVTPNGAAETDDESLRPDGSGSTLEVRDFENHGTGVSGRVDGDSILVGHPDLFRERDWSLGADLEDRIDRARGAGHLPIVVGRNGRAAGLVVVGDEPRNDWAETVSSLQEDGIEVVVLTGDERAATEFFRRHDAVDRVFAGVPPEGKTEAVRRLARDGRVAMVGDGTNDAPALAEADLGISLGSGTALASDASDLAIVEDDLSAVERAFRLATAARRRVRRNLALALVYNAIAIPVAAAGLLNPLFATAAVAAGALCIGANVSWPLLEE